MIRIRDPLHGTIQLSDLEGRLLDSQPMQRLRGIRQLAMAYLVYPGANHTRFEHSIGTLFLADKICRELSLPKEKTGKVRAAALLHDVGHTAFSHEAEAVLMHKLGTHEQIGKRMVMQGELGDILSGPFSKKEIANLCDHPLGEIITSDIGADRMDYLLRDSHYTGVAYGVIDAERICSSLEMKHGGLLLCERGLSAAENLLVARFTMFSTVYLHKTVRIASRMLQQAITLAISDGTLQPCFAIGMSDAKMLEALGSSPAAGEYASRLKGRRLYKKAYGIPLARLAGHQAEIEGELSEKCDCSVLLDIPRLSAETSIKMEKGGKISPLSRQSELVSSLQRMQKSRLEALVICGERHVKKVSEAAKRLLGK